MGSWRTAWGSRSARAKVALLVLPIVCLVVASSALATGLLRRADNPLNPSVEDAAKIVGIQQLVATYVADWDWGPVSHPGTYGRAIGDLFTPKGNWPILYWNAGHPKEVTWTPADGPGPDYSACNNIGPAAIARAIGKRPLTTTAFHHNINDIQIVLDPGGKTATVRGEMDIIAGQPNSTLTGGTTIPIWTGHYYGHVRLTKAGWKFELWEPIVDQPINLGADCSVNNPPK